MTRLWIFNAGHEESLKYSDDIYRTPKREIIDIRISLFPLMRFVASSDDLILSMSDFFRGEIRFYCIDGSIFRGLLPRKIQISVWAVEPSFIKKVIKALETKGIRVDKFFISERIRDISHRIMSSNLLSYMTDQMPELDYIVPPLWKMTNVSMTDYVRQLKKYLTENFEKINYCDNLLLKQPFTSSGRGLLRMPMLVNGILDNNLFQRMNLLGEFSVEPLWNLRNDWAIEYYIDDSGRCEFVALSKFLQNNGRYMGNILCEQDLLQKELSEEISPLDLENVIECHKSFLSSWLKNEYVGYIGVDMITYTNGNDDKVMLYPAVEINLRMTMGLIAYFVSISQEYKSIKDSSKDWLFTIDSRRSIVNGVFWDLNTWEKDTPFVARICERNK